MYGSIVGDKDEWVQNKNMTFHKREDAEKLVSVFEILSFEEEEQDKPTAAGDMKHWHVFHFIVKKS